MSIISGGKEWNASICILAGYVAIGFAILFVLPDKILPIGLPVVEWGIFGAISAISSDHERVSLFCSWSIFSFPILFLVFSIYSPVKMKRDARADFSTFATLVIGFILFGVISCPCLIYYLIAGDLHGNSLTRLDRLAREMTQDKFSLFLGANIILSGMLSVMWIAYVAIPTSFIKLIRMFRQSKH